MTNYNPIMDSDRYKTGQSVQYQDGTTHVFSYIEARSSKMYDRVVVGPYRRELEERLSVPVTQDHVEEAQDILGHGGSSNRFRRDLWMDIVTRLEGRRPLLVKALPEGTVAPIRCALATVVNTDPLHGWLTSYSESSLVRAWWYGCEAATRAARVRAIVAGYLRRTCDAGDDSVGVRVNDFGARGASSYETAELGGLGHLMSCDGTDNLPALKFARDTYGWRNPPDTSVFAAEHSTITSWGRTREVDAYRRMIEQGKKWGIYSVVSDSWDFWAAVDEIWGQQLRQAVIDAGAILVVRPDSGDVLTVPLRTIEVLGARFGFTVNRMGYRVLKSCAVLQGDGINSLETVEAIYASLEAASWSAENLAIGAGSFLIQDLRRDNLGVAMKCSATQVDGTWLPASKNPVDAPEKASKNGRLAVISEGGPLETVDYEANQWRDELRPVLRDGVVGQMDDLVTIRERLRKSWARSEELDRREGRSS